MEFGTLDLELFLLELLVSPFLRVFGVLLVLLFGLGLRGGGFSFLSLLLALGVASALSGDSFLTSQPGSTSKSRVESLQRVSERAKGLTAEEQRERVASFIAELETDKELKEDKLNVLAFCFSELEQLLGFSVAFLLPLVVLEIVLGVLFALMSIQTVSVQFAALPIKLFVFLSVGGVEALLSGVLPELFL